MGLSTPTGADNTDKLNKEKIRRLIMAKFAQKRSEEDKLVLWSRCKTAIQQKCQSLRNSKKKTLVLIVIWNSCTICCVISINVGRTCTVLSAVLYM